MFKIIINLFFIITLFCSISAQATLNSQKEYINGIKICQNDIETENPPDIYQEPSQEQEEIVPGDIINQPDKENTDLN
jgi:hypothetical protein